MSNRSVTVRGSGRAFSVVTLLALSGAVACGPKVPVLPATKVARPVLCYADPDAAARPTPFVMDAAGTGVLTVDGALSDVVIAPTPGQLTWTGGCSGSTQLGVALSVTDGAGKTWTFGLGLAPDGGTDQTPTLDLAPGEQLKVQFVQDFSHAGDHALRIVDARGLAVAADDLRGALLAGREQSFSAARGDLVGPTSGGDCGSIRATRVHFAGDTSVDLAPGASATFHAHGGEALNAFASWSWMAVSNWSCSDPVSPLAYLVWR